MSSISYGVQAYVSWYAGLNYTDETRHIIRKFMSTTCNSLNFFALFYLHYIHAVSNFIQPMLMKITTYLGTHMNKYTES